MRTGIPQLNLPPTEPMNIKEMEFEQGSPPVVVRATFSDVVVQGLSDFIIDYIEVNTTSQWVESPVTVQLQLKCIVG